MTTDTPVNDTSFATHERDDEIVYPVYSRRSGGLSVGINLFPGPRRCNFSCPYCEVLPLPLPGAESLPGWRDPSIPQRVESGLVAFAEGYGSESASGISWRDCGPVRDLCISGNGEPTLSPHLCAVIERIQSLVRRYPEVLGGVPLVIITNATGFTDPQLRKSLIDISHRISSQLESASGQALRDIEYWVKLDAATQAGFEAMSGTDLDLASIMEGILAFSRSQPVIIQSMLCTSPIRPLPGSAGAAALASRIAELVASGARINALQLYTVARTTTEPDILPCTDDEMRHAGLIVRNIVPASVQVRVYGERGLLR